MQRLREAVHKGGGTLAGPNMALERTGHNGTFLPGQVSVAVARRSPRALDLAT